MKKIYTIIGITSILILSAISLLANITFESSAKGTVNNKISFIDSEEILKNLDLNKIEKQTKELYGENYKEIISRKEVASEYIQQIDGLFSQNLYSINYPDYYGGKYINDEGNLVVEIITSSIPKKSDKTYQNFSNIISNRDDITIKYVENSYNELDIVNQQIISYFKSENEFEGFIGSYIDEKRNLVIVELENDSASSQNKFKNEVINSNLIKIVNGTMAMFSASTLNSGAPLPTVAPPGGHCSVGYRAKLNGVAGFVTAGHCVKGIEYIIDGDVKTSKIEGNIDAAFVSFGKYTPSNALQYNTYPSTTLKLNESLLYLAPASPLAKSGATTNLTIGNVATTSWSGYVSDGSKKYYLTDLLKAELNCTDGDSGGVVFTTDSKGNLGGYVLGIISACSHSTLSNSAYIVKINNIKSNMNVSRY